MPGIQDHSRISVQVAQRPVLESRIAPFAPGQADKARTTRRQWGAVALPWMILTDPQHKGVWEGSSWTDLEAKLAAPGATSAPATQPTR